MSRKLKPPRRHEHVDVPTDWTELSQLEKNYKGGFILLATTLPAVKAALIRGMTEAGTSQDDAEAHIDEHFIKVRKSPSSGNDSYRYVSPTTVALMEQTGLIKSRWVDYVSGDRQSSGKEQETTKR